MNTSAEQDLSVLIVDDDRTLLDVTRRLVEKVVPAARVFAALGGEAAMTALAAGDRPAAHAPTIVLLDIDMPPLGGFEVLRWVRQRPSLANTKVVMFSSSQSAIDIRHAEDLGAQGYLVKYPPVDVLRSVLLGTSDARYWPSSGSLPGRQSGNMSEFGARRIKHGYPISPHPLSTHLPDGS